MVITSPLAKNIIVIFVILSANSFYRVTFLPEGIRDLIETMAIGLVLFFVLLNVVYNPTAKLKKHFKVEVLLFLLAVFLSMFIANHYHGQDFKTTLIAQRFMYFYAFYFLLHDFNMKGEDLINIMLGLGFAYVVFFILQYIAYPVRLFDIRIGVERGTLRIFLGGLGFMFFAYYMYLQRYLTTQRLKYGIFVLLFFLVGAILQGTRQLLASMTLLTMAFIFFNKQVKSRMFIILLSAIAGVAIFFILYDMFMELILLTQKEATEDKTNIRVLAMTFFLNDFMPGNAAYIFGNGQDSMNSSFGQRIHFYKIIMGFYQSDIGLIGDYTKFGVLFVVAQLSIFIRIIFGKLHPDLAFLKYLFIALALTLFSGRNLFGNSGGIVFGVAILYLIDYYKNVYDNGDLTDEENER